MRIRILPPLLLAAAMLTASTAAWCQSSASPSVAAPTTSTASRAAPESAGAGLISDAEGYFTAPLHWNSGDWAWFAGSLVAIGVSHHYDAQVRTHFQKTTGLPHSSSDVQDAVPAAAVFAATALYANLINDESGRREAWAMLESGGLSAATSYALKFAISRRSPHQTSDPNQWFKGGGMSFPSTHATVAFAFGTVLAESGGDDYRWVRRLLGYGLGAATSYQRLKHNAHWLSDTVGGAALGCASAHFVMNRAKERDEGAGFTVVPVERGAMLTYRVSLP